MGKLVKCKTCGEEIAKNAKFCPKCGAKRKKHTVLGILLVIIGVFLFVGAFGAANSRTKATRKALRIRKKLRHVMILHNRILPKKTIQETRSSLRNLKISQLFQCLNLNRSLPG